METKVLYIDGNKGYSKRFKDAGGSYPANSYLNPHDVVYYPRKISINKNGLGIIKFAGLGTDETYNKRYSYIFSGSGEYQEIVYDQYRYEDSNGNPIVRWVFGENPVNRTTKVLGCYADYGAYAAARLSGYSFVGWYSSDKSTSYGSRFSSSAPIGLGIDLADNKKTTSTNKNYLVIGNNVVSADVVAVFGKKYYIYFNKNGGSGWMKQDGTTTSTSVYWQAFYDAEDYYLRRAPSVDRSNETSCAFLFYKEGHVFNGWDTKEDGTGTRYYEGDDLATLSSLSSSGSKNVTLYAQWAVKRTIKVTNTTPGECSFTIKDSEGNVLSDEVNGVCSVDAVDGDKLYVYASYDDTFYTATLDGISIDDGSYREITVSGDVDISGTFTTVSLYAVNISCDSSKGSVDVSPAADKDGKWLSKILTFTIHSNRGYTPSTFSAKSNGVSVIGNETMTLKDGMEISTTAAISDDVDVSISFDANAMYALARLDGESRGMGTVTPEEPINVSAGDEVEFNAEAADSIFVFDGWYDAEGESVSSDAAYTATVSEDTILYARFKLADEAPSESTTTAAYATGCSSAQGGVSIAGVSAEIGSAMKTGATGSEIVLAATVANGYSFDGWYSAATGGTKLSSSPRWKTFLKTRTVYAKFASSSSRLLQWEGSGTRKTMTWRSKTYVSPKPFNPVCCRVDAREYEDLVLKVDMYSSPDDTAKATGKSELDNIASQDPRRLPMRRPERYVQVEVTNDDEVDAILVGTSMEGIVA